MGNYTKTYLSSSTLGQPIFIPAANSAEQKVIHEPTGATDIYDEVWLYAGSSGTVDITATIFFSGLESFKVDIPPSQGLVQILPGIPVGLGTTVGIIMTGVALGIGFVTGYVNNIDQT